MNPHVTRPAETLQRSEVFWYEGWLWEVADTENKVSGSGVYLEVLARSHAPPHHYATVHLSFGEDVHILDEGVPLGTKVSDYIAEGMCPWCDQGPFERLDSHVRVHGITAHQLRERAA